MRIMDGKGRGSEAAVNSDNRLTTHSIAEQENIHQCEDGEAYNLSTGLMTISGDATLCYFYNGEEKDFVIETIIVGSFTGITHSGTPYITIVRNPTGGDLISDATTTGVLKVNRNFGSTKTLASSFFYKGKVSGTLTGGGDLGYLQVSAATRNSYPIYLLLKKGSSIGLKLTAAVSSGSASYYVAFVGYLKSDNS